MSIHLRQSSWFDQAGFTCCASQARAFLSPGVDSRVAHGILFQVDRCLHVAVVPPLFFPSSGPGPVATSSAAHAPFVGREVRPPDPWPAMSWDAGKYTWPPVRS